MKKINPKNRVALRKPVVRGNKCYCYVMTMTAQWYLPGYMAK